jgi:hypothetical protein
MKLHPSCNAKPHPNSSATTPFQQCQERLLNSENTIFCLQLLETFSPWLLGQESGALLPGSQHGRTACVQQLSDEHSGEVPVPACLHPTPHPKTSEEDERGQHSEGHTLLLLHPLSTPKPLALSPSIHLPGSVPGDLACPTLSAFFGTGNHYHQNNATPSELAQDWIGAT